MKKIFFVFVFAVGCSIFSNAQFSNINDTPKVKFVNKFHFNVEAGTQFGFGKTSGASVFVAPRISFPVTNRLTVGGGIIYLHSVMPSFMNSEMPKTFSANKNEIGIFVYGDYKLTDRVSLNGTYQHGLFPMQNYQCGFGTQQFYKLPTDTYSVGLDYKLSEHASFGIQISNNPYPAFQH